MQLERVEINDYRSIFADERSAPLILELADGMNALVGTNNCGKSNVLRAIALALDPQYSFDATIDNPGPRRFAHPVITLQFRAEGNRPADRALLDAAAEYEANVAHSGTFAEHGVVVLRVSFEPTDEGTRRRELLATPGGGVPSTPESERLLEEGLAKLREAVRFVLISSGESLRSVLDGNFREILHSVVKERLSEAFEDAEASRVGYLAGIQESLLGPLRDQLIADIGALFPEIDGATLVPEVPTIERTLSNVRVGLEDLVDTPLSAKGTGVRGGVLVAMLSYLASNATRGMIFAVEEPEAFLHPAAQEDLRDQLESIALREDVSLIVTTHSPYIFTRSPHGKIFGLAKDQEGRTRVGSVMSGDAENSAIVRGLFRDSTFEGLVKGFDEATDEPVLFVEGVGDKFCLTHACAIVGRPELLDGLRIKPVGGASKTVVPAIVAQASNPDKPVLVLLDNDPPGRDAVKELKRYGFKRGKQVLSYVDVFPENCQNFEVEAEDLFHESLWEAFIEEHGKAIIKEMVKRPDGEYHYGFDAEAKELLVAEHIESRCLPQHVLRWIELVLRIRQLAGLEGPEESAQDIVDAAKQETPDNPPTDGHALIAIGKLDHARYQRSAVLVLDTSTPVPPEVTHVGFYLDAAIKPEIAQVLQHYASIRFSAETVKQLRSTGNVQDQDVAEVINQSIQMDDDLAGTTRQLLLLSSVGDERTFVLDRPIQNTKEKGNKPLAWAISPRVVPMGALIASPSTTTELDGLADEPFYESKQTRIDRLLETILEFSESQMTGSASQGDASEHHLSPVDLKDLDFNQLTDEAQEAWNDPITLGLILDEARRRVAHNPRSKASQVLELAEPRFQELQSAEGVHE